MVLKLGICPYHSIGADCLFRCFTVELFPRIRRLLITVTNVIHHAVVEGTFLVRLAGPLLLDSDCLKLVPHRKIQLLTAFIKVSLDVVPNPVVKWR